MIQDKKAAALEAFAAGATWEEAARRVGVTRMTLWRWCQADAEFADAVAESRDRSDDLVEFVTFQNCMDPDAAHNTLRMFWLKSRKPEVYGDRSKVEVSGKDSGPIELTTAVKRIYGPRSG